MKTQPKSRFALALTILTLASLACSISLSSTPTPIPTNTPTPTATILPSATPPPTSPPILAPTDTPEASLDILACAPDSDTECPEESVTIASLFPNQKLEYEGEYAVTISRGTQIRFFVGWCTLTEDLLQPNLNDMEFVFDIDHESFVHLLKGHYFTSQDDSTPPNDTYCYSVSGVVSGWERGHTYRITFGFMVLAQINDGWDTYPPANYTRTYLITVQ